MGGLLKASDAVMTRNELGEAVDGGGRRKRRDSRSSERG